MPTRYRATLFANGGSQAVRLPKECRLKGKMVDVWGDGSRLIVEPVEQPLEKPGWPEGFWEEIERNPLADDFELPDREKPASDRPVESV